MQTILLNNKPTISIGMPVYNGEKYIREALDSILAQAFTDFELIISDNCSSDKTQEICAEYVVIDSRVRYLRHTKNIGAIGNFEFVLHQASGQFFMWVACDDYLENIDYLSTMVNKMQEGYDFCFPGVKLLSENGESNAIKEATMDRFAKCLTNYDFCKETVYICSYQTYGVFNRSFLIDNFKYIKQCVDLRLYAEGLFVHAITSNSLLTYVPSVNLVYRRHATNISSVQPASHLLVDFYKFSIRLTLFYVRNESFSFTQKASIISAILYTHGRHFLLILSTFFPKIRRLLLKLKKQYSSR